MSDVEDRLAEIETRAAAATEGPWALRNLSHSTASPGDWAVDSENFIIRLGALDEDAAFIAATPTVVPNLTAALRAVLAVCNEIEPNAFGDSLIEADDILRAIATALSVTP